MADVVVHDFQERLAESNALSDEGTWIHFYRRIWPDMIAAVRIDKDSKWQRWGIDRQVLLPNGKQILIDEKKRREKYDDFLCEEWSVFRNGRGEKIGWTLDEEKRCDYIAYAVPKLGKCVLLPFELLRITAQVNIERWKGLSLKGGAASYPKDSLNRGYVTRNVAVDWDVLFRDLRQQMLRRFGESLELPTFDEINGQFVLFNWANGAEAEP